MKLAAAAILLLIALVCAWAFYLADPMFLRAPTDAVLAARFHDHRAEFNHLVAMAREDGVGQLSISRLNEIREPTRRRQYHVLLLAIGDNVILAQSEHSIRFIFGSGGLAAIGPGWLKGIEFLSDPIRVPGVIVDNLDRMSDLAVGSVYLRPLESDWYIVVQKLD